MLFQSRTQKNHQQRTVYPALLMNATKKEKNADNINKSANKTELPICSVFSSNPNAKQRHSKQKKTEFDLSLCYIISIESYFCRTANTPHNCEVDYKTCFEFLDHERKRTRTALPYSRQINGLIFDTNLLFTIFSSSKPLNHTYACEKRT